MDETPPEQPVSKGRRVRKIVFRVAFVVGALALSVWVLSSVFDSLDWDVVWDSVRSLDDAEIIALLTMWVIWLACQGLQTSSMLRGLPVRRGVVAFLGPAAVTSIVPGPSDLPVRFKMMRSWGFDTSEVTLAVAAGGIFSVGIKLLLPIIAAVGLLISGTPLDRTMRTIVTVVVIVAVGVAVLAFILGSERRTVAVTRVVNPVWRAGLRLLRREGDGDLTDRLLAARSQAIETLRDRWLVASWSAMLTAATRYAILLESMRFMGVGAEHISWAQVFVVYALVQGLTAIPISAGDAGISDVALIAFTVAVTGEDLINEVTAAVLIFRLLTWVALIPTGFAVLGGWSWQTRRAARTSPDPTPV